MATVKKGDRIAQLVLEKIMTPVVMETEVIVWLPSCQLYVCVCVCRTCLTHSEAVEGLAPLDIEITSIYYITSILHDTHLVVYCVK